uniref:C-type lectin domain-containing protein n=1 Tax=Periophthalmus magnuspinnatus TaxID=409849 RepID=A0A3B3ZXM2_9GOBI
HHFKLNYICKLVFLCVFSICVLSFYEESKRYCREMYTDLATIHNFSEMNDLINLVSGSTSRAWIGLELADKRTWHWSLPGHTVAYTNWREGNPQDNDQDACVAVDENGKWFESDCKSKMSFVCDGGSHVFVADTKTWRDAQNHCRSLSTDLVSILSAEENAVVSNMSQNIWIGLFKDPWKWSDGSDSSFRYWSAFQPNYLEGQNCVTVIFKNSGKWNDLKCPGKRAFICQGDNLVLVQQNLTWVEAITYCRSNYIDLVHISTENVQMKVAEKAKNATTPHVWIGLKYTCHSKLWFWIRSSSGCYQNWAPQQGYEGNYNCGATGAIQATGRQQWVGLPQTEKLNFICYGCVG